MNGHSTRARMITALTPAMRAILPDEDIRHLQAAKVAINPDARVSARALVGVLPLQTQSWYLAGPAAVATNVEREIRLPQDARLKAISVQCKTAPVGSSLTVRLTRNGTEVDRVNVANGTASGASGEDVALAAGDVLRVDVLAVGSTTAGANLTVQVAYLPSTG